MYRPTLNRFGGPPVEWNIIVFFSIIIFSASSSDSSSSAYSIKKSSKEKKNKFLALISIDSKRPFTRTKKGFLFFPFILSNRHTLFEFNNHHQSVKSPLASGRRPSNTSSLPTKSFSGSFLFFSLLYSIRFFCETSKKLTVVFRRSIEKSPQLHSRTHLVRAVPTTLTQPLPPP